MMCKKCYNKGLHLHNGRNMLSETENKMQMQAAGNEENMMSGEIDPQAVIPRKLALGELHIEQKNKDDVEMKELGKELDDENDNIEKEER